MIIGITGSIASGKSTVSRILKENGFEIIDADLIAKQTYEKGKPAYFEIVDFFGKEVLMDDGVVNRKDLGEIVFSNSEKLKKLNEITHKYAVSEVIYLIEEYRRIGKNAAAEVVMLFESGLDKYVDQVWYVEIESKLQLERLKKRNGFTKQEAQKRINAQQVYLHKAKAGVVILNNGDEETLRNQVLKLINAYLTPVF